MKASAHANKPFGYKAVIVHGTYPFARTEILARKFVVSEDGRSMIQTRAGKNFPTREAAIAFAQTVIDYRQAHHAAAEDRYSARHPDETR